MSDVSRKRIRSLNQVLKVNTNIIALTLRVDEVKGSKKYTRNEWGRCGTTLETSEEDVKLHPKRVEKM